MSIERHYFPGNNTPLGFYSYYKYILGQREAHKIICIKGGPGTGKSTFMKKIGAAMAERGEDIDYLHCSADENSLDGIVLKKKKNSLYRRNESSHDRSCDTRGCGPDHEFRRVLE